MQPTETFVERLGVILETDGLPRIAGRLFGVLILSPEPLSLDELARRLGVSKASVSVDARLLEQRGVLERVSLPGDRKDYYAMAPDLFRRSLEQRLARWSAFHEALASVRPAVVGRHPVVDARLEEMDEAYHQMLKTITTALDTWTRRHRTARRRQAGPLASAIALAAMLLCPASGLVGQQAQPQRLTLGDAIRLAAGSNVNAMTAGYQADQAQAQIRQRRAALLPHFSASALESGRTSNTATFGFDFPTPAGQEPFFDPMGEILGPVNTLDLRARLSERLYDAGARGRVRTATSTAEAARARATAVSEDAGAMAGNAYLLVQRAAAVLMARRADSVLADSLVRIARERLDAGTAVGLDVTRAQAQAAGVRAQLIAARTALDRARLELAHTLGLPIGMPLELLDSLEVPRTAPAAAEEDSLIRLALGRRPDVLAADAALRAAAQSIAAVKAERLPSLDVFGDYGTIARNGRSYVPTYAWGVAVVVPIFNGFEREGRIDEYQARLLELQRRHLDLMDQVALDVRTARLELTAAFEQVSATQERLELVGAEARQSAERFQAGLDNNADVITALLQLNGARITRIDALMAYHRARVLLARAEGAVTEIP